MEEVRLKDIVEWTGSKKLKGNSDCRIASISTDSRTIRKEQFFIPIKGENYDGHNFIGQAVEKGACGFVFEGSFKGTLEDFGTSGTAVLESADNLEFLHSFAHHYLRKINPVTIGITGSVGKTTAKDMLVSILKRKHKVHFTPRNYNNEIGIPLAMLEMEKGTEFFIAELGMRKKGQIRELSRLIDIDMAVITMIGGSHLQFFDNVEQIAMAKAEIAESLDLEKGILFLNHDMQWASLIKKAVSCNVLEFGINNKLDYNFTRPSADDFGKHSFGFCRKERKIADIKLNVAGYHNIYNGCAAAAVAHQLGEKPQDIRSGLKDAAVEGHRMEVLEKDGKILISDCYNASPLSLACAIDTLALVSGKKAKRPVAILSDMLELGQESARLHYQAGKYAREKGVDTLIAFGKLSRYTCEGFGLRNCHYFGSREELINDISRFLRKGDVVLIKGSRANKMEDIIKEI